MKMINRKKIKFCALLALSVFLAYKIIAIDYPFSSVHYYDDDKRSELLQSAINFNGKNPEIFFHLANRNDILLLSDEKQVNSFLLNTLKHNPLHMFALIRLADAIYESGNNELSAQLITHANQFSNLSADRLWELSFVAYKLGKLDMFYDSLKTITKIDDNRREHVYKLGLKLINNKEDVLTNIVNENAYTHYFSYVFGRMYDLENSKVIYSYFKKNGIEIDKDLKIKYIDFLVNQGESELAGEVWSTLYGKNNSIVWNGGFEQEILNEGLGWKIDKAYDYNSETTTEFEQSKPLKGKRSLKIKFLDKNVDYKNVSQTVLVKPNTEYIFSSLVTTKDITTSNGVGWEIRCFPKGDLYKQTEYLTGDNIEKILFSKFVTPDDCRSLVINLRRQKSSKFDKYISGEIIVDDVLILEAG